MFTWIQRYFQKHFGIIFVLILLAMAVPLIMVFTPSSGIGQGDRKVMTREVFGYNLGSPEDQARLFGDANLSATLQLGYAGIGSDQLQQYALQRAAALHMANELHVPPSTKQEVTEYIKGLRVFATADGGFDAARYAAFRDSLKPGGRITEADVSRVLGDDIRADKVRTLLSGPGYVLDADVASQLKRVETTWTLGLATIDYASYQPAISPTNDQLAKFFGDNTFRYEIPPRVSASYVNYPLTAYLSQVTTTEDELHSFFAAAPARFQKTGADGKQVAAGADDFALVRAQVETTVKLAKARQLAIKAASDLSLAIYESKLANDPTVIESFLGAHRVKAQPLQPFTQNDGPAELNNSAEVAAAAFKLDADRFYSDAIPVADGAVVLFWKETQPARTPLLSEVLAKVTADYIESEKRRMFVELGRKAKSLLETRLKAGTDFTTAAQAVASSTGVKIDAKMLAPFAMSTPPQESDFNNYNVLETLTQGAVSDMVISKDKGVLVYAAKQVLPDLTPANPKFEEMRAQIAAFTARMGASRILSEMVEQELRKTAPKL